jgi:glycosyltransferase involved in cell wall biosynthesis
MLPPPLDSSSKKITLFIIVPCYNEEEALRETSERLRLKLDGLLADSLIAETSRIVFIDDGSTDGTWNFVQKLYAERPDVFCGIKLSRNRGHQNALICGLLYAKDFCDAAISIDADLQDDISVIDGMVRQHIAGREIVLGVRSDRKTDGVFKRASAQGFYTLMKLLGVDIVYNHADFRLMGRRSLEALAEYGEINLFLRGIIPQLGFSTGVEYYARSARIAGESKYPLHKMLRFALEGVTSFSIKPIRMIAWLGMALFCASVVMIIYFISRHFSGNTVTGWSSMIVSLWGIGGLILAAIGIVGEYIGKIYLETKRRPRYTIETVLYKE